MNYISQMFDWLPVCCDVPVTVHSQCIRKMASHIGVGNGVLI